MKFLKPLACASLVSVMLVGCGANNDNNDRFANDNNGPLDVRYEPGNGRNNVDWDSRNDLTYRNNRDGMGTNVRNDIRDNDGLNANNTNRDNKVDLADDIADEVTKLDEVDRAYVFVTNNNAYVAVKLNNNRDDLNQKVEKKIADQTRKVKKGLDNVFVSANPDFVDRMRGYRDDFQNGHPISGFFDEFTETVERIFPTSR